MLHQISSESEIIQLKNSGIGGGGGSNGGNVLVCCYYGPRIVRHDRVSSVSSSNSGGITTREATKFPYKLWHLVNNDDEDSCEWCDDGESIVIYRELFAAKYLNKTHGLFKTNNFTSFIRQLNLYGFRKVHHAFPSYSSTRGTRCIYKNPMFIRGKPELLESIKRKRAESNDVLCEISLLPTNFIDKVRDQIEITECRDDQFDQNQCSPVEFELGQEPLTALFDDIRSELDPTD
ncbi:uncharacterized protein LOC141853412 [Brevipalpus obovatus]|uniref:uncharacterized protein LOC141853412 n=1 Tax=Brevipalpus obovatus TaxID=246614 RepID=UPI003D9EA01A